jgi:NAD(P)H-dependent FMN reductase
MQPIVSISGTSRPNNFTHRALAVVEAELATLGRTVSRFDARELTLSFPGLPQTADAARLQQAVREAPALVLATPEYHGTFCAMTKLIIENLGFPSALAGKPIALLGVAAGRIGAIKSLEQLKGVCSHAGAIVVPGAVSIAGVNKAFDAEGRCTDPSSEAALRGLGRNLHEFMRDYVCPRFVLEEMVRDTGAAPWTGSV